MEEDLRVRFKEVLSFYRATTTQRIRQGKRLEYSRPFQM